MTVTISRADAERLQSYADKSPDSEICGLLFGTEARIDRFEPVTNVAAYPRDSFELDPQALFTAIRAEREGGAQIIGHYHSHPGGEATPSARDARMALNQGLLWLIIGTDGLKLWRVAAPGVFVSVELALESDDAERQ